MPDSTDDMSTEGAAKCRWEDVLACSESKECSKYCQLFVKEAGKAAGRQDSQARELFDLLALVTSLPLTGERADNPFPREGSQSSGGVEALCDSHLQILSAIVHDVEDAELRARVADVLNVRLRKHRIAELAVDSYLETASTLEDPHCWFPCFQRIERALNIAASLGKSNTPFKKVIRRIEDTLAKYRGEDPKFLSVRMMALLIQRREGDPTTYATLSENGATLAEKNGEWKKARDYWELKAEWHAREKDEENQRDAKVRAAETYVHEAEEATKGKNASHLRSSSFLASAITALRKIGGTKQRVEELHRTLLSHQKKAVQEMQAFSCEVDITEWVKRAVSAVSGKEFPDALLTLAVMGGSPKVGDLREQVQRDAQMAPLQHLFSQTLVDADGKVKARQPSPLSGDADDAEAAIRCYMHRRSNYHRSLHVEANVKPALRQINLEHFSTPRDFLPILVDNPFVPEDRVTIYCKGLHAGLVWDTLAAAHFLIPQLENSIRHVLSQHAVIPSRLDDKLIQMEFTLGKILYLQETKDIFGEDLVFDLQGLLVDEHGANLRDRMAHGLMSEGAFLSADVLYAWWLVLRLCCVPILRRLHRSDVTSENAENQNAMGDVEDAPPSP